MKVPDGGEMVMVESSAKSDSPSVELNVDETEEDDDNDDGYREVQLDLTPEIEVFHLLFERCLTKFRKRSIKQHIKYFNFRSLVQLERPLQPFQVHLGHLGDREQDRDELQRRRRGEEERLRRDLVSRPLLHGNHSAHLHHQGLYSVLL